MTTYNNQVENIADNLINWGAYYSNTKAAILRDMFAIVAPHSVASVVLEQLKLDIFKILECEAAHPDFPEAAECLPEWKKTVETLVQIVADNFVY